jgi:PleD family two-component response regulator
MIEDACGAALHGDKSRQHADPTRDVVYSFQMAALDKASIRRVLLVEDDEILRTNYETLLSMHRLAVRACATKSEAIEAFDKDIFDVVILDITLGGDDEGGFALCSWRYETPREAPLAPPAPWL